MAGFSKSNAKTWVLSVFSVLGRNYAPKIQEVSDAHFHRISAYGRIFSRKSVRQWLKRSHNMIKRSVDQRGHRP